MKRMWIGVGLLALALVAGLLSADWMERTHEQIGGDIRQAAVFAMEEEWDRANAQMNLARRNWQKKRPLTAALADHEPLENVDSLFDQLKVYADSEEVTGFCAVCADLGKLLEALGECHRFTVSNLF